MAEKLSSQSQIGDLVKWRTLNGEEFEGKLEDWDSNVAIVRLTNTETLKAIEVNN